MLADTNTLLAERAERREEGRKGKKKVRVSTDMWLVEQPQGGEFHYLSGGIDAQGKEVLSVSERVRWRLEQDYYGGGGGGGGRGSTEEEEPLLVVVAITDGARTIRCQLERIFGQEEEVPLILDMVPPTKEGVGVHEYGGAK